MNQNHKPTLRIHGPVDLLTGVPYLLGFQPIESLVLIGLTHGILVVTARLDLNDAVDRVELVGETVQAMLRGGSSQFVVAIFTEKPRSDEMHLPYTDLSARADLVIEEAGGSVLDALLVTEGLWWSYMCGDPQCCPPAGRALPDAPTPFAAAATVAGLTVAPSRGDLDARFDPDEERRLSREVVVREEHGLGPVMVDGKLGLRGDIAVRAIRNAMKEARGGSYIEQLDIDVARLGAALRHHAVRDAIWLDIDQGADHADELWLDLARRLPSPYDAAPLFLFGWSAWRQGNGALASMAVERVLSSDADYAAGALLRAALHNGVAPHSVPLLAATDEPRAEPSRSLDTWSNETWAEPSAN